MCKLLRKKFASKILLHGNFFATTGREKYQIWAKLLAIEMMPMTAGARWVCWWVWVGASFLAWHKQNKYKYKKQMQMQLQKQIQIQLLIQMRLVTAWGKVWALVGRVSPLGRSNHTDGTGPAGFCGSHEYDYERKYKYCSKCKYWFPLGPLIKKKIMSFVHTGGHLHTNKKSKLSSK